MEIPPYDQLMLPLFKALKDLGGSASIAEIDEYVGEHSGLPTELLDLPHNAEKSNQTEFQYRLAWARTYLKKAGLIDNSSRGVWVIASEKRDVQTFDPAEIVRKVRELHKQERSERDQNEELGDGDDGPDETDTWRRALHQVLTTKIDPSAFERLVQRLLRESGFIHVEVTGRSGDGGIDGKGIVRINGMLSFHVHFQCKRYQGTVSASHIRDFRGAMVGRADKGLFITTGTFTRDAVRESTRDGAPPLDLIDGDQLADKLKELSLGIETQLVEQVLVDENWFRSI
ncbi:restriction endonuclease [Stieleria sp. ICT_E10.1]|uniref:restriction endonuclease n=1 Tax=Stieleria sedimenti TaxID=2976331 RepID=UPI0021803024|nr:restriction endonuclease [Stieleria sedimenti]MCS7469119.1 restriction endonuclease [Stieleria sedimenti]